MRSLLLLTCFWMLACSVQGQASDHSPEDAAAEQTLGTVLALTDLPLNPALFQDSEQSDALVRSVYGQLARQARPRSERSARVFGQDRFWTITALEDTAVDQLSVWMLPLEVERFVQGELIIAGLESVSVFLDGTEQPVADGRVQLNLPTGIHDLWLIHGGASEEASPDLRFEGASALDQVMVSLDAPARVTAEQLTNAETVSMLRLSPDGQQLALRFAGRDEAADLSLTRVEIRAVDTGEVVKVWTDRVPSQLLWSPDSETLAVHQDNNLWLYPDGESPRLLLANHERLGSFQWHPDGQSLLFSWTSPDESDTTLRRRVRSLEDRWGTFRNNTQWFEVDVDSGLIRPLTAESTSVNLLDVDPDGDRVLMSERIIDYSEAPHSLWQLFELRLNDLERRDIRQLRVLNGALFAADGYWLLSGPGLPAADGATTEAPLVPNEYDTQLYALSASGDSARSVSREFDPSINSAQRLSTGDLLMSVARGEGTALVRFDVDRERFEDIDTGFEVMEQFSASETRRITVAVRGTDATAPQRVHLLDLDRGLRELVFDSRPSEYGDVEFGAIRPWTFINGDGDEIDGRYYLPPQFDPEQRYPLIVYYYGGTVPVGRAFTGRYPFNLWAAKGYVIYVLQPRGTIAYGQDFSALHVNAWGQYTADDIIEGTRQFLEAHDFVDPERVGNIGASYGGFMTMHLATLTDIYAASISHAGISTLTSYWGEGWWGYGYSGIASRGSFPWNNRELYIDQSPIYNADKITTPLLLLTGDADTNVPPGESDTMFTALKLLGREVELIEFPGEDHWILDREKRYVWWDTMLAWFDLHLKDQPEWWEYLYPDAD